MTGKWGWGLGTRACMEPGSNRTHEWPAGQNGRDCIQRSDWPRSVQKGCLSGTLQGRREVISFFPHNEVSREGTMLQTHCFLGVLGHLDFSLAEGGSAVPGSGHSHLSIPQGQSVKLDPQTLSVGPKDRSLCQLWSCLVMLTYLALNPGRRRDP